jgi:hypothetical protein
VCIHLVFCIVRTPLLPLLVFLPLP